MKRDQFFYHRVNSKGGLLWLRFAILAVAGIVLFHDGLIYMVTKWNSRDFSYCYLMPLVVAYIIWEKRDELAAVPACPSWSGLPLLLAGILFFWIGELGGEYFTLYLGSWFTLAGILWMMLGWRKIRVMGFALFMIAGMFPLPNFFQSHLSLNLKLLSSDLGARIMQMLGMTAYRTGNVIDLGFTRLQVVDACSGLRYFFPLIIMGLLIAYFSRAAMWKKVVLVLSTLPLVVISNGIRLAVTGILYRYFGPVAAEGFFHDFAGFFMFMISLMVLVPEMWFLMKIFPEPPAEKSGNGYAHAAMAEVCAAPEVGNGKRRVGFMLFSPPQFVVALLLLCITIFMSHFIELRERVPVKKPFSAFPMQIGQWHGKREVMEQKFIDALDFSDYLLADYVNSEGKTVNFYVAYYESQRKGESIHSPTTCLTGGGWIFKYDGDVKVTIPGMPPFKVKRVVLEQPGARELAYYWFPMRGRVLSSAYQMKIYNFIDAIIMHRTDGALVRIMTPLGPDELALDGDVRIRDFMKQAVPVLEQYLPD